MPFETPFPAFLFAGSINALQSENGGVAPQTIIRTDQSWAVTVNWTTTGFVTGMIAGEWHLHLYLESIGPGPDLDLIDAVNPGHIIPLTPGPSPVNYSVRIDVPAGTVTAPPAGQLYKLAVTLTYFDATGAPGPMAAFQEGSLLQFYNP
jgi:hypothetical protein